MGANKIVILKTFVVAGWQKVGWLNRPALLSGAVLELCFAS